jgi:hypothetical protein
MCGAYVSIIDRIRHSRSPEQADLRREQSHRARTRPIRIPLELTDPMTAQFNRTIR